MDYSKIKIKTYFCQMVTNRLDMMRINLERAFPYFDQFVIVDGGSTDGTVEWLDQQTKVDLVHFKWCDNFPLSRNQYLNRVGELREPDEISLVCVADDDELYSQFFMEHIKDYGLEMLRNNFNQLAIRCRSVTWNRSKERVWESLDEFWKPLIFFWEPGIHYADTRLHETLVQPSGMRQTRAPDKAGSPDEVLYEHIKLENVIWPRGMRNFYTFGGGPNLGNRQLLWAPFRDILSRCGDFENWTAVEKYLEEGNVSQELKDWLIKYRCEGFSPEQCGFEHEGRYDLYDGSSEVRECFLTYFVWFHPEELPEWLIEHDKDYKNYVHEAQKIHGPDVKVGCPDDEEIIESPEVVHDNNLSILGMCHQSWGDKEVQRFFWSFGYKDFYEIQYDMVRGVIICDIKDWMIMNRVHNNPNIRAWFVLYFGVFHPEQNIYFAGNNELPYKKDRKPYGL